MNAFEIIAITDIVSTIAMEFWADYKAKNPNPMTAEEFATISTAMRDRRKAAIAAINAH